MERTMDSLRQKFYTVIAEIQSKLVHRTGDGWTCSTTSPSTTRAIWSVDRA